MAGKTDQRRRKKRIESPGLDRFFQWWGRELAYFVPRALRASEKPSSRIFWLEFREDAAILWRHVGNSRSEIGRINLAEGTEACKLAFDALIDRAGDREIGISLPPSLVLRRHLSVPMVARDNLRQALLFEMDRQTPYTGGQVYFRHETIGEDPAGKSLSVQITVVPRSLVDQSISYLREWGRAPCAVALADELKGDGRYVNLLPDELRPKRAAWRALLYPGMATVTLALLAILLLIPVWQKRETVIALHPVVADASRRAEASNTLKARLQGELGHYNFLPEKKLKTASTVALIDELTRLLPDDTWVQQLDLHGSELQIQGETGSSARLIGLFEQSKLLSDASFRSPLTKGRGVATSDRFQLVATVREIALADALAAQELRAKKDSRPRLAQKTGNKPAVKVKLDRTPAEPVNKKVSP